MRIVWLSANRLGYETLKEAVKIKDADIVGIITLSSDFNTKMYDGIPTKEWSRFGTKVYEISKINQERKLLAEIAPDIIIMCGWRQIIDKSILRIPKKSVIGFHPTLLPKGRGPAPIINSILNGFVTSGVTMFYVDEGLDNGDIIGQVRFKIEKNDHASDVYNKVITSGKELIRDYLPKIIKECAPRIKQDESKATVFKKPLLSSNEINPETDSIEEISKKIKALSRPYEGAYIRKNGKRLIIWEAELIE
ncbi:hypothetical protein JXB31_03495 [Candidatus Woesearchaeota archaeon]|nr:hypothetical protein [Candidatus Woesearchaeota archaeon]